MRHILKINELVCISRLLILASHIHGFKRLQGCPDQTLGKACKTSTCVLFFGEGRVICDLGSLM